MRCAAMAEPTKIVGVNTNELRSRRETEVPVRRATTEYQ
ncbi:hypothetical protein FBZ93_11634 [Bradyrhizobium macuxiense]|uniref:Uncharacterized protein n=1 Tax=Bradyrhizobium macuxiense TaxID=1755647 RepID=A0A560L215_9BRAD|nr:hypothetical protein FBZ93_11634 [Bradyrhizobium macuxiense]